MNRLIAAAEERLEHVRRTGRPFTDDDFIVIPGLHARPAHVDLSLARETLARWPVGWGAEPQHVVSTRRLVRGAAAKNLSRAGGGAVHSLTSFLSYRAIRCDPDRYDPFAVHRNVWGADDMSTNTATTRHVAGIEAPLLITASTADSDVHLHVTELIADASGPGSQVVFVPNGDHFMRQVDPDGPDPKAEHLAVLAGWITERLPT